MKNIINNIHTKLEQMASSYLVRRYDPRYKELGELVFNAINSLEGCFNEETNSKISYVKECGTTSMSYLVSFYGESFSKLAWTEHSDCRRLAKKVAMLLFWANGWTQNMLNPGELNFFESAIRDAVQDINNQKGTS